MILGFVGALVGGFLAGTLLGIDNAILGINLESILIASLGAILIIALVRAISRRRAI
jgi:uncharacterized membrane protein YeaQ/YmgE (transglycosylase-associated protein family)